VGHDVQPPAPGRHLEQVVPAPDKPGGEASQPYPQELAECLAVPQRTHHPQGRVDERSGGATVEHPGNVPGEQSCLAQRVLREAWVRSTVRCRDGRAITERPDLWVALTAHGAIDDDMATSVSFHGQAGHDRAWDDTCGQDDGFRIDRLIRQM